MFDALGDRFRTVFSALRGELRLTPESVESALRRIRMALLEADVNFKVVKAFVDRVRDRAIDQAVLASLTPAQQVVGIVRDELLALFGGQPGRLAATGRRPQVVMLLGLQGAGKTTTAVKLGRWLARQGRHPLLVSTDVRRPAAITQLAVLSRQADLRVHDPAGASDPAGRARSAVEQAAALGCDVVIVDTAGRLHVDAELMAELESIAGAVEPSDRLYVGDAMTGQDAVRSAGEFHRRSGITGIVLTKMDGDARGGAALSIVAVVGVPIVFSGSGERLDDFEAFKPERVVSRMLGMGDVLTLVERAEQAVTRERAQQVEQRLLRDQFTLEDLREQFAMVGRMGPLDQLAGLIPGLGALQGRQAEIDPRQLARTAAIIDSMTPGERRKPASIDGSRRKRIARGSGVSVEAVNRLLRQFAQMRKMLRTVRGMAGPGRTAKGRRGRRRLGPFAPRPGLPR